MAKPPAKPGKTTPAESEVTAAPKSKKILLIVAGILLLVAVGGATWYFTKNSSHADVKERAQEPPKFFALEPFTVNLQSEEGEKFLQTGITLKIANLNPDLEEKIKERLPEIRSRIVLLLSSKHASELATVESKKKLAQEIAAETSVALGLRTASIRPVAQSPKPIVHEGNDPNTASEAGATALEAAPATAETAPSEVAPAVAHGSEGNARIMEVLFTSFIIQ